MILSKKELTNMGSDGFLKGLRLTQMLIIFILKTKKKEKKIF